MADRQDRPVALITGAARGIGAACARRLAADGAAVAVTDVIDDEGRALADELERDGRQATYRRLDVTDEDAWTRVVDEVEAALGPLTVLVNNAGIGTLEDVESETREGWERTIAINQTGVWLGMKLVGSRMRERGKGSIINVSSIFGLLADSAARLPTTPARAPSG